MTLPQDSVMLISIELVLLPFFLDASVFFAYSRKSFQTVNKEQANKEQQQPIKSPKHRKNP